MKKEFIPYEQALALKKLGFNDYCLTCYLNGSLQTDPSEIFWFQHSYRSHSKQEFVSAPTFSQAFRWFREKYNFISEIKNWTGVDQNQWYYMIHHNNQLIPWRWVENKSYEEVELACLMELIEIVKQ